MENAQAEKAVPEALCAAPEKENLRGGSLFEPEAREVWGETRRVKDLLGRKGEAPSSLGMTKVRFLGLPLGVEVCGDVRKKNFLPEVHGVRGIHGVRGTHEVREIHGSRGSLGHFEDHGRFGDGRNVLLKKSHLRRDFSALEEEGFAQETARVDREDRRERSSAHGRALHDAAKRVVDLFRDEGLWRLRRGFPAAPGARKDGGGSSVSQKPMAGRVA